MLNNLYALEYDTTSEEVKYQYNKYIRANRFKFHDFYHSNDMKIAKRPFDNINVQRQLGGLPINAKPVNYAFYNL